MAITDPEEVDSETTDNQSADETSDDNGESALLNDVAVKRRSTGKEPSVTTRDIESSVPQHLSPQERRVYERMMRAEGGTGVLPESAYYPAHDRIGQVATSPGGIPIIGAPKNLYPWGIVDAREKSLQQAAQYRAAREQKVWDFYSKVPETKNAFQQEKLADAYHKDFLNPWMQKAQKAAGKDWVEWLNQNPDFKQGHDNYVTIAKKEDQILDRGAKALSSMQAGKYTRPATREALEKIYSGKFNLADPKFDAEQIFKDLEPHEDLIKYGKEIFPKPDERPGESKKRKDLSTPMSVAIQTSQITDYSPEKRASWEKQVKTKAKEEGADLSDADIQDMWNEHATTKTVDKIQHESNESGQFWKQFYGLSSGDKKEQVTIINPASEQGKAAKAGGGETGASYAHQGGFSMAKVAPIQVTNISSFNPTTHEMENINGTHAAYIQDVLVRPILKKDMKAGTSITKAGEVLTEGAVKILKEKGLANDFVEYAPVATGIIKGLTADENVQTMFKADRNLINKLFAEGKFTEQSKKEALESLGEHGKEEIKPTDSKITHVSSDGKWKWDGKNWIANK